jgi:hypothetical protein
MRAVLLVSLLLAACSSDPDDPLPPPPAGEGFQVEMTATVPAGTEIWECKVTEIPFDGIIKVNHVESVQSPGIHHMDISVLAFAGVDLDVGTYDCNQIYADYPALMENGLIVYAAQQAEQSITLPEGTVAQLPGGLKIMQEIHYVNATSQPVEAFSKINIYKYTGETLQTIWGNAVRDTNMDIPVGESTQWTRCVMDEDIDVLFLSSHTHQLGRNVEVKRFDGAAVGELVYSNDDWHTPQLKEFADAPLHVAAGTGFEFACHFSNPTGEVVHWGFKAEDEMCQIALVFTPGDAGRKCNVVETSDGVLPAAQIQRGSGTAKTGPHHAP